MDRFAGRVALVTGVSSGIGAQVAEDLVRSGVVVVGVARRQQRLEELAAKLANAPGKLHPMKADVSSEKEVQRVYQWIEDNLGGVSIVVNNAAMLLIQPVQDLDATSLHQIVNTNVTSVMVSCREALVSMKKHNITDGHIININSVAGHRIINSPVMSVNAYSSTKHAITAFCKGLRYDIQKMEGFNIKVTSVSPGGVATEMIPRQFVDQLPNPTHILKPKDVSDVIIYALSCPAAVEISELTVQTTGEGV